MLQAYRIYELGELMDLKKPKDLGVVWTAHEYMAVVSKYRWTDKQTDELTDGEVVRCLDAN